MTDRTTSEIAIQRVVDYATAATQQNPVQSVASTAYVQSKLTQAAITALFDFLQARGILSRSELNDILTKSYNQEAAHMTSPQIVMPPGTRIS